MTVPSLLRRCADVLAAGALATLMTVELVSWADHDLVRSVVVGLLSTLPLAFRRRLPLVAFILVMSGVELLGAVQPGFDNDSLALVFAFVWALYSLGRHARGTEGWLGVAALLGAMVLFLHGDGGLSNADLGDLAFVLAFAGAPWAAGLTLRLRQEQEAALGAEHRRLVADQGENARRAVADERARIARELHDVVSHAISVTVLQARGARCALGDGSPEVRDALDAIEHTNTQALGDMRRLLAVLRDAESESPTDPQPSLGRLDALLDDVRRSGLAVELVTTGTGRDVPPGVDLSAYRIVQESLTNVLKHADDARAQVLLDYGGTALAVTVRDDGVGTTPHDVTGHGLIGIRERVAVVGGDVAAGPRPEGGFEVRAVLPYSLESS